MASYEPPWTQSCFRLFAELLPQKVLSLNHSPKEPQVHNQVVSIPWASYLSLCAIVKSQKKGGERKAG